MYQCVLRWGADTALAAVCVHASQQQVDLLRHLLKRNHVFYHGHFAYIGAHVGRQLVDSNQGAQQRVEKRTKVIGREGGGAVGGRIDEDKIAVIRTELDEAVNKDGGTIKGEEVEEFLKGGGWDESLQKGYANARGGDYWMRR